MKQHQPTWQVSMSFNCVYLLFDTRFVDLQPNCCITADLLFYNPSVVLYYSRFVVSTIDFMFYTPSVVLHYSRFVVLHYSRSVVLHYSRFVVLQPICCLRHALGVRGNREDVARLLPISSSRHWRKRSLKLTTRMLLWERGWRWWPTFRRPEFK